MTASRSELRGMTAVDGKGGTYFRAGPAWATLFALAIVVGACGCEESGTGRSKGSAKKGGDVDEKECGWNWEECCPGERCDVPFSCVAGRCLLDVPEPELDPKVAGLRLATSNSDISIEPATTLIVTKEAVRLDDEIMGKIADGVLAKPGLIDTETGPVLEPLRVALEKHAAEARKIETSNPSKPFEGYVLFAVERDVPFVVVKDLLRTAELTEHHMVMFLVESSTLSRYEGEPKRGIINMSLPRSRPLGTREEDALDDRKPLNLTVDVKAGGFQVTARPGVLSGDTADDFIPKKGDGYDFEQLTKRLTEIKALPDGIDETQIILMVENDMRFEILVKVMDAARKDGEGKLLFPDVILGGDAPEEPVADSPEAPSEKTTAPPETRATVKGSAPSSVDGEMDSAGVAAVVKRHLSAVRSCYERGLKRDGSLGGKIRIRFTIDETGRIVASKTRVTENSMGDAEVAKCVTNDLNRWRFPAPDGGTVTVVYPFVFTTG